MSDTPATAAPADESERGSFLEVLAVFTKLGLTSFGGPVAYLGYFHEEIVERRKWMDDASYADLVALCQFLPGPASSQTGIGVARAGIPGVLLSGWALLCPQRLRLSLSPLE